MTDFHVLKIRKTDIGSSGFFKLFEGEQEDFSVLAFGGALPLGTSSVAPEKAKKLKLVVQMETQFCFKCLIICLRT